MGEPRVSWIDVLKEIGIVLVVIGHIYLNPIVDNWLYSFHMPLFFWAGGLVYKEKPILVDVRRRIQTIVVPYFSFGFLILLYWQIIERRFRESSMSLSDSILGLFFGDYDKLDFNVHLWFLPCFFLTVILFNILVCLGGNKVAYTVSVLMSCIYIVFPMQELYWGFNRVFKYIGFYAIGVLFSQRTIKILEKKVASFICACVLLSLNFILAYIHQVDGIMWYITALIGGTGVVLVAYIVSENYVLQYLGRVSLIILCIHGPIYRIVVKILSILLHLKTDTIRNNFLLVMIVVGITIVICSLGYEVVMKIFPWMLGKRECKKLLEPVK